MKIKIWGCRGSIPSPGPEKNIYGGNTSCVQIIHDSTCIILDGGSGIRNVGTILRPEIKEINLLLTHLHFDHIVGLGFFQPFYNPKLKINIWGPAASKESLTKRLRRYFSPPLFPVRLSELPCKLQINEISESSFTIDSFKILSGYVCHPGPTVGYRIEIDKKILAYIPDHEPALGSSEFPRNPEWTSGYSIAENADLLLHDAQYDSTEYATRIGWGHSSMSDAIKFGKLAKVKKMLAFHHDPFNTDMMLQSLFHETMFSDQPDYEVELAREGMTYFL